MCLREKKETKSDGGRRSGSCISSEGEVMRKTRGLFMLSTIRPSPLFTLFFALPFNTPLLTIHLRYKRVCAHVRCVTIAAVCCHGSQNSEIRNFLWSFALPRPNFNVLVLFNRCGRRLGCWFKSCSAFHCEATWFQMCSKCKPVSAPQMVSAGPYDSSEDHLVICIGESSARRTRAAHEVSSDGSGKKKMMPMKECRHDNRAAV